MSDKAYPGEMVSIVRARERVQAAKAHAEQLQLHKEKELAIEAVYEAAARAVLRLNEIEWPNGFVEEVGDDSVVLTHIGMRKPLHLGSDGVVYRYEQDDDDGMKAYRAPLHLRKQPSDILHIVGFLDRLGT